MLGPTAGAVELWGRAPAGLPRPSVKSPSASVVQGRGLHGPPCGVCVWGVPFVGLLLLPQLWGGGCSWAPQTHRRQGVRVAWKHPALLQMVPLSPWALGGGRMKVPPEAGSWAGVQLGPGGGGVRGFAPTAGPSWGSRSASGGWEPSPVHPTSAPHFSHPVPTSHLHTPLFLSYTLCPTPHPLPLGTPEPREAGPGVTAWRWDGKRCPTQRQRHIRDGTRRHLWTRDLPSRALPGNS